MAYQLIPYPIEPTEEYLKIFTAYINSEMPLEIFLSKIPAQANNLDRRLKWDIRSRISAFPNPPLKLINTYKLMYAKSYTLPNLPEVIDAEELSLTEQIIKWRELQATQDYTSADKLRRLIEEYFAHRPLNPYTGKEERIPIKELRQIAAALVDIQKVQRMAIGLSTENVGVKLDGVDESGSMLPIVQVLLADTQAKVINATPTAKS
jgi:hypothetical protein